MSPGCLILTLDTTQVPWFRYSVIETEITSNVYEAGPSVAGNFHHTSINRHTHSQRYPLRNTQKDTETHNTYPHIRTGKPPVHASVCGVARCMQLQFQFYVVAI